MPAKRKNTGKQSNGNAKQAKQDGQKAVSHEINVPIDEGFKEGKLGLFRIPIGKAAHPIGLLACHLRCL